MEIELYLFIACLILTSQDLKGIQANFKLKLYLCERNLLTKNQFEKAKT